MNYDNCHSYRLPVATFVILDTGRQNNAPMHRLLGVKAGFAPLVLLGRLCEDVSSF